MNHDDHLSQMLLAPNHFWPTEPRTLITPRRLQQIVKVSLCRSVILMKDVTVLLQTRWHMNTWTRCFPAQHFPESHAPPPASLPHRVLRPCDSAGHVACRCLKEQLRPFRAHCRRFPRWAAVTNGSQHILVHHSHFVSFLCYSSPSLTFDPCWELLLGAKNVFTGL